ncbi:WD40 repeat domain-containing serine/threonine protein kinase [Tundrisphaera lichenicola]|uniref:WD40 repeat domain-containing serine/threonine protein kinase n=1 Tax=Tundrisphaera lichenicola TaxID=2029860 RepID=UPI003EB70D17
MSAAQADRNLLFGILALQMNFIGLDQLVAGIEEWVRDKSRSIDQILVDRGSLDPRCRELLVPMVAAHVEQHEGDPARSLAALSTLGSVVPPLTQLGDPDIQASLVRMTSGKPGDDPNATRIPSAGPIEGAGPVPFFDPTTSPGLRYRILRPHARGGIGVVSVAHDRELNREVALKEIQERHADEPNSRARFLMEAEVTGGLEHPGIVPVYGLGHHPDGRPYYAMRFIRGDSLKEAIERFHRGEWAGSATRTLEIRKLLRRFLDVCDAITYAHSRGILHRDLKPGNIMLGKYGETLVVDWGLAKTLGETDPARQADEKPLETSSASGSAETLPGSAIGTPAFMSPEQASGDLAKLGPASDVYSLGSTLYSLLTGRLPIEGSDIAEVLRRVRIGDFPPPRRVDRRVDLALDAICRKAMALRPEDRYPSARDLADDLEHWLADEPVSAHQESVTDRLSRWSRRHRTLVISATAILLTVTSGSAWIYKERLERHTAEAEQVASEQEAERAKDLALASKKEADQANKLAQLREYHNLLSQAREDRRAGRPGWTWAAIELLERAAGLDLAELDPVELRTEAAASLGEIDLRLRRQSELAQEMTAYSLAFSPDGRQLAIAQSKAQAYVVCSVKVIDLKTNQVAHNLNFKPPLRWLTTKAVQDGSRVVAFGPGGRLAVGARSGRVHCWNLSEANAAPISWDAHPEAVTGLAFSADGGVLYSSSIDRTVRRWDMTKPGRSAPKPTHVFQSPGEIKNLSLDRAGRTLAASGAGIVHLLDPSNLVPRDHAIPPGGGRVALSPDGRTLAIDRGGMIELVAPSGDLSIAKFQDTRLGEASGASISGLMFSSDGSMLATACSDESEHSIKLWDVASGRLATTINVGGTDNLDAAFGPDGRTLATIGERGAWVFDIGGPDVRESVAFHPRPLLAIDLAPHGRTMASLSGTEVRGARPDGVEAWLWDLLDGPLALRHAEVPGADKPHGVAFDAEGRLMAFRGAGPRVEFLGLPGMDVPKPMDVESLTTFGLSADGTRLWAVAKDDLISRNVADGALRTRWSNLSSQVLTGLSGLTCLSVGRDWIVIGGYDGYVRLIRAEDGQPHATWNPDQGPVRCVGLSPDQAFVATGSPTGWVTLFGRETGEKLAAWYAHSEPVQSVCFSDDGRWLASGSVDRIVRLYRREGERWGEFLTLPEASGSVRTVRFGPGGKTLVVLVDGERAVRVWHLDRLRERLAPMGLGWPETR